MSSDLTTRQIPTSTTVVWDHADRERVRSIVAHCDFIEIYCDSSIENCESRDVKGIYKKAVELSLHTITAIKVRTKDE